MVVIPLEKKYLSKFFFSSFSFSFFPFFLRSSLVLEIEKRKNSSKKKKRKDWVLRGSLGLKSRGRSSVGFPASGLGALSTFFMIILDQ